MAPLITAVLVALSATAFAQDNLTQVTWGAVTFAFYGEKIPSAMNAGSNLTPLGAQQMYEAGQIIRDRYLSAPSNGSQLTTAAPINGLSSSQIDNPQLSILATDDEYISTSAMAFLQGLYPPVYGLYKQSILSDASTVQYPLDGYQYPSIATVSTLDYNYLS